MSYLTNLEKDHVDVNYFVRVGSRILLDLSWTQLAPSGPLSNVYSAPYTGATPGVIRFKNISTLSNRRLNLAASFDDVVTRANSGLDYDGVFHDQAAGILYLNGTDPTNVNITLYAELFYFLSTIHVGFHQKPDDGDYPHVQYHGVMKNVPPVPASTNEVFFGFAPSASGQITVANENGYLSSDFFDGSISNCTFEIYRCVGDIVAANTQLVFRGLTRDCSYNDGDVTISFVDAGAYLDASLYAFRNDSAFEPNAIGAISRRFICGEFNRVVAVANLYSASKSNLTNRTWTFGTAFAATYNAIQYATTDASVGSNTTTRTYLDDLTGMAVGTWIQKNALTAVYEITAVGANYIDHTALSSAMGASDYFILSAVQSLTLLDKSNNMTYDVPYTEINAVQTSGNNVAVKTTLEATLGLSNPLHPEDYVVFGSLIYTAGYLNFPSTAAPLGTRNPSTGQYDSPVQVIYELLYSAGFNENPDYYDTDSFEQAATDCDIRIAIASPKNSVEFNAQSYREVIAKICETAMLKLFMKNGKWTIGILAPMGTATVDVGVDELKENFSYRKLTEDIAKEVTVKYDYGEVNLNNVVAQNSNRTFTTTNVDTGALSNNAKTITKDLALVDADMAELMSKRYAYLFSLPLGFASFEMKLSKMEIGLNDIVNISPTDFTELPFTTSKKFSVTSIRENEGTITVEMFDQAGVENNSGDWT